MIQPMRFTHLHFFVSIFPMIEFQKILELPESTEQQKLIKYERLSSLAQDFKHTAKR